MIYKNDDLKIITINDVKDLIDSFGKRLIIKYKTKETSSYRIDLSFQIQPDNDKSKLIIEYTNKKDNSILQGTLDIIDYEDLYSLVDNLTLKDDLIVFLNGNWKIAKPALGFKQAGERGGICGSVFYLHFGSLS